LRWLKNGEGHFLKTLPPKRERRKTKRKSVLCKRARKYPFSGGRHQNPERKMLKKHAVKQVVEEGKGRVKRQAEGYHGGPEKLAVYNPNKRTGGP